MGGKISFRRSPESKATARAKLAAAHLKTKEKRDIPGKGRLGARML